jgi:hypothetical protein
MVCELFSCPLYTLVNGNIHSIVVPHQNACPNNILLNVEIYESHEHFII